MVLEEGIAFKIDHFVCFTSGGTRPGPARAQGLAMKILALVLALVHISQFKKILNTHIIRVKGNASTQLTQNKIL